MAMMPIAGRNEIFCHALYPLGPLAYVNSGRAAPEIAGTLNTFGWRVTTVW